MATGTGPGKRLTQQEWSAIQARYEAGDRVVDLARESAISAVSISNRAKKCGWRRRDDLKQEAISEARQEFKQTLKARYRELAEAENENDFRLLRAAKKALWLALERYIRRLEALSPGDTPGRLTYELVSLVGGLRNAIEGGRSVLRLDGLDLYGEDEGGNEDDLAFLRKVLTPLPAESPSTLEENRT